MPEYGTQKKHLPNLKNIKNNIKLQNQSHHISCGFTVFLEMCAFVSRFAIFRKLTIKSTQNDVQITSKTRQKRCQNIDHFSITKKCSKRAPKGTQKRARKASKTAHFRDKTENGAPRGSRESPKRYFRGVIRVFCCAPPLKPQPGESWIPQGPQNDLILASKVSLLGIILGLRLLCSPPNHIIQTKPLTQT